MQKKIIALAVAGLVSGAAFAQSNVTVFGIMDIGYEYAWDHKDEKTKDQGKVKAGGQDGSRVGFRGTEDLGNGLKANFEFVMNFDGDTGINGGRLAGEGAKVGLSGKSWGSVDGGYMATFMDENSGVDVSGRHGVANTGALYDTGKWSNFIAYKSPIMGGFQGKVGYSSNIFAQDNVPVEDAGYAGTLQNVAAYSVAASYENGGLKLGAAYAAYRPQSVNTTDITTTAKDNGSEWNAGISYDFKVVAVSLFGARNDNIIAGNTQSGTPNWSGVDGSVNGAGSLDHRDFIALGVAVPIGSKDIVKLGYGKARTYARSDETFANGTDKDDATAWGITYFHNLSKRTNIYAMYGNVDSENNLYSAGGNGYKQAFNVGVRHLF